jgi:hypothetical protein
MTAVFELSRGMIEAYEFPDIYFLRDGADSVCGAIHRTDMTFRGDRSAEGSSVHRYLRVPDKLLLSGSPGRSFTKKSIRDIS